MNEAQWRELQQIRDEQNRLADRLARLDSRLRSLEKASDAQPAASPAIPVAIPLPPPMPPPVAPEIVLPPMPTEAYGSSPKTVPPEVPPPSRPSADVPEERVSQPAAPKESLEVRIGTTWLVRVGVVMVLTAFAFLGSYLYKNVVPHLGPAAKVGLLYLGAGMLAGVGAWLERSKEAARSPRMLNFARVVLAGGLSAVYYVTYAAHWNPNLLILRNPLLDGALLVGWTGFMVWLADRRGSEILATFAILLAYYASAVNEIASFTLFSNLLLTVAAVYLLRRHLWKVFPYASLLATFGSYGFWRYYYGYQSWIHPGQLSLPSDRFWVEGTFLLIYWLLFTWSVFAPGATHWTPRRRAGFASLNNSAFFVLTTWILHWKYHGAFWMWALGFGCVLCILAEACRWVRPRVDAETEGSYLVQGIVSVTLGFLAYFNGWQLGLLLAAQSVVLFGRAQVREERLPLWASMASAVAAFMVAANQLSEWQVALPWPSALGAGALLVVNAWWSQTQLEKSPSVSGAGMVTLPDYHATLAVAPAFFSALGLAVWLWVIERTFAHDSALVPVLAMSAALLTASLYFLRVRVVPYYALAFLSAAYLHRFAADDLDGAYRPGMLAWSMVALFVVTLALGHWWQCRWPWTAEQSRPPQRISGLVAGFIAVLAVLLLYDWLRPSVDTNLAADVWVAENAALSLALLAYGLWTQYRALAGAGQALLCVSAFGCVLRVWWYHPVGNSGSEMAFTLVPLLVMLATIFAGRRYVSSGPVKSLSVLYEAAATLFLSGWVGEYVSAEARFTVFSVAGALLAVWAQVRREGRWLWWSGTLTFAGVIALALLRHDKRAAFLHLLGIAAIAGQQRLARYWVKRDSVSAASVPECWQGASMIVATLCAWAVLNARMTSLFDAAFTLAGAWSLFAAAVFVAGLTLREKIYRWLGLTILVCTFARVAVVDIWQLDSLGRSVSALCLGLVLLGIGYLYNRFHAKWHDLF